MNIRLVLILAVAWTFRAVMLVGYVPASPWVADMVLWDAEMGRNLKEGRGWVLNEPLVIRIIGTQNAQKKQIDIAEFLPAPEDSNPASFKRFTTWAHTPGYSLWFALSYLLGGSERYIHSRILQAFFDGLACLFLFGIGRRLWSRSAGYIAAGLYAFSPAHVFLANLPVSSCLDSFAFLGVAYGIVRIGSDVAAGYRAWKGVVVAGLCTAFGAAMNSAAFMLPLVAVVAALALAPFARQARRMVVWLMLVWCLAFAVLAPWGFRNLKVNGQFTLMRQTFWQFAWETLGEIPNPWGLALENDAPYWRWTAQNCPDPCPPPVREATVRNYLFKEVFSSPQFPGHVVKLAVLRVPRLVSVIRSLPLGVISTEIPPDFQKTLFKFLRVLDTAMLAVFPLALAGLLCALFLRKKAAVVTIVALAPSVFVVFFSLVFFVEVRKTLPAYGFLFALAGIAVSAAWNGFWMRARCQADKTANPHNSKP